MAVIHISREEAASSFTELIAKADAGEEVRIHEDVRTIAVLRAPKGYEEPRLLSEIVARFACSSSVATTDPHFATDIDAGIRGHAHERLIDPHGHA